MRADSKLCPTLDLKERGTWDYKSMMGGTSYLVCYFLGQGSTKTFLPKTLHWETHHSLP